ncbi:MAG: putative lipid II flippase FtsW [Vicinamibacteria bacterium]
MAKRLATDRLLMGVAVILFGTGLLMLWSASQPFSESGARVNGEAIMVRQLFFAILGVAVMLVSLRFDYRILRSRYVAFSILGLAMVLLLGALASPSVNETNRWIRIWGGVSFQPSEFAKLAIVIFLASEFERRARSLSTFRDLLAPAFSVGVVTLLVYLEPDFGSAIHIALVASALAFLAGVPFRLFVIGGAIVVPAAAIGIASASYRLERIFAFLDPWGQRQGPGYQLIQSVIAVGSGGPLGRGFMRGEQKTSFLPYPYSDFIFGVVGEELGFIGALIIVGLFLVFLWRGLRTAQRAPDLFGRLLAAGLSMTIVSQAFINMSVVLGLSPTKGIPLPFFSAGGTSLVLCLLSVGLVLNVSQHTD